MTPRTFTTLISTYNELNAPEEERAKKKTNKPKPEAVDVCIDEAPSWW